MIIQINLKVIFTENYPAEVPIIEILDKQSFLIPKYLINKISAQLSEWENNIKKNASLLKYGMLEDLISELLDLIEKFKFINTFSEQEKESAKLLFNNRNKNQQPRNIIPYPKTCSFTWNPNGQLLAFNYHKIDFSQLKQSDKIISNFNDLDDWVKYCKSKDYRNNKFSKSENKLFEEDSNVIIYDKLRDLVDWKAIIDDGESAILNSINKAESFPNLFASNIAIDIQQDHFGGGETMKRKLSMLFIEEMNFPGGNNQALHYGHNSSGNYNNCLTYLNQNNDDSNLCLINENTPLNNSGSLGIA